MSVSIHKSQSSLPPSERDFELYEVVVIEGQSTRKAAAEVGLSQTRIVQITASVSEWIGSEVPQTAKLTPTQRLGVARDIAERRLDFLYSQAMEGWRASQGPEVTVRTGSGDETTITRQSHGDVKYLSQATRIVERAAKVAFGLTKDEVKMRGLIEANREATETGSGVFFGQPAFGSQNPPAEKDSRTLGAPPEEDCSARDRLPESQSVVAIAAADASDDETSTSAEIERRRAEFLAALSDDTSPVQPPLTDRNGMLLDEPMEASPPHPRPLSREGRGEEEAVGWAVPSFASENSVGTAHSTVAGRASGGTRRPLNRRERRARQRKLEKALARAK